MEEKNFFSNLFDFSFAEFVTTRIIKLLFAIAIIAAAVVAISLIVSGFGTGVGKGILLLILSPVIFILYVLGARVCLELIIVMFRIAENTGKLLEQTKPPAPAKEE